MIKRIKQTLRNQIINIPGFKTNRRIVVIESDDWGAVRQNSAKTLSWMEESGMKVRQDHYIRNDALASETDLIALFNVLRSVQDRSGRPASITANTIMANPDFEKMESDGLGHYCYEVFTKTLKKYPEHNGSFELWKEGLVNNIFYPQFHGREHLHVHRWLKGLQMSGSETKLLFERGVFALCSSATMEDRKSYMAAWEVDDQSGLGFTLQAIKEGLEMFEEKFGYRSFTSIAPNYTWNREMEEVLLEKGVKGLQGGSVQRSPDPKTNKNKIIRHYTGQINNLEQVYTVRNCRFEPSADPSKDWVNECLKEINTSFRWGKPAIIESHRVNFIGFINPENRNRNLKLFRRLLKGIIENWPDVEFMTSDQLCRLISDKK